MSADIDDSSLYSLFFSSFSPCLYKRDVEHQALPFVSQLPISKYTHSLTWLLLHWILSIVIDTFRSNFIHWRCACKWFALFCFSFHSSSDPRYLWKKVSLCRLWKMWNLIWTIFGKNSKRVMDLFTTAPSKNIIVLKSLPVMWNWSSNTIWNMILVFIRIA